MFGSSATRTFAKAMFAICLCALISHAFAADRAATTASKNAATSSAPSVTFIGTLAGPGDLRKSYSRRKSTKVGADPCHRHTTDDRNPCDSIVDVLAGAATDDRSQVIQMNQPRAIITDAVGRLLVTDSSVPGLHVFDMRKKKYTLMRLAPEGAPAELLAGIALDSADNIYVTEQRAGLIHVYAPNGRFLRAIGRLGDNEHIFDKPSGIAIDRDTDRIYVADAGRDCLFILDSTGTIIRRVGERRGGSADGAFRMPSDVVLRNGLVYVHDTQNRRLQVLDLDGNFKRQVPLRNKATSLAVDERGNIYLGNAVGGTVTIVDGVTSDPVGEFGRPSTAPIDILPGIWVTLDQQIYVSNQTQHRVEVFRINHP